MSGRPAGRPKGAKNKPSAIKIKNKKLLLSTLRENLGIIAPAIKISGISRQTFYNYYNNDLSFRAEVDEIRDEAVDFVESSLYKQIKANNTTATIFYLKCKARDRGYIDQVDTNMTIDAVKIKYIMPDEQLNFDETEPTTPLNNEFIKIELPK